MTMRVWAEVTSLEHGHGGDGWGLGTCLWSPGRSKDGARRYNVMTQPTPGDEVFHFVSGVNPGGLRDRYFYGTSRVLKKAVELDAPPPQPGAWAGATTYYRIDLDQFSTLPTKLPMGAIEAGLAEIILADLVSRPKYYPYAPYSAGFRVAQGIYLTLLTPSLTSALRYIANLNASGVAPASDDLTAIGQEYSEGERSRREANIFRRNPALRRAAVEKHGTACVACGFDFGKRYGNAGEGYVEVHHLNPLAERIEGAGKAVTTTVDDVVPLCSNCHRVVHRRRPALSLEELRAALAAT